jgi:hypothetical protein
VTVHTFWRVRDSMARAQTVWLGLGLMVGIGIWPLLFVAGFFFPPLGRASDLSWLAIALQILTTGIFAVCLGVAITRYRLFDIDVIVNLALVYGALTGALAAVYVGGVVLVQGAFRALAACFQPLRARIQAFIDRRFYRRTYDAARVLAAYGAALRDDAGLEALSGELLRAADQTMRPAHASLWLREADGRE